MEAGRAGAKGGLIPARAGKTGFGPFGLSGGRAHPRAGGENQDENIINLSKQGSSPRGRGKRDNLPHRVRRVRLIPARAGKTSPSARGRGCRPAHPRAGGENTPAPAPAPTPGGSSPRGRGKLWAGGGFVVRVGLIPARAGKTAAPRPHPRRHAAHPRAGGENVRAVDPFDFTAGSSPLGRGKRCAQTAIRRPSGLIPARAGKTRR